ncbi:MAG: C39 family peptidase [Caldilineaceae bacterium]
MSRNVRAQSPDTEAVIQAQATPPSTPPSPVLQALATRLRETAVSASQIPNATATQPPLLPKPTPSYVTAGEQATLSGFSYIRQTWNNRGPATLAMNLSYWGSTLDQATIGSVLRPFQDDKNVGPVELAEYAQLQGYRALVRVNGSGDLLRTLLANDIPVIIETWLEPHPGDGLGHYRLLVGYDDVAAHWIGYDSYYRENLVNPTGPYQGIRMDYAETDALWKVFNRTYVVIYTADKADLVADILGEDIDAGAMWARSLQAADDDIAANGDDTFAWFNRGSTLTARTLRRSCRCLRSGPIVWGCRRRMLWYQFGPFQAYYESGRYEDVLALADSVLNPAVQIEELYYWKAEAALRWAIPLLPSRPGRDFNNSNRTTAWPTGAWKKLSPRRQSQ